MPPNPAVRVYCLGHFRIEREGGAPDEFAQAQAKPLALLKTLIAFGGQNVPEDQLLEALWPDADGDAAHTAFTSTLYRLRQLIGQESVGLRHRKVSLDPRHVWWDVRAFDEQADRMEQDAGRGGAWEAADDLLALYRGPFLDGEFEPPEVLTARDKLHSRFLRLVREAGESAIRAGQSEVAMRILAKALEIDPVAEDLCQGLMGALGAAGRHTEAEAAYQRLRRNLEALGGAAPSAKTEELRAGIARQARSAAAPEAAPGFPEARGATQPAGTPKATPGADAPGIETPPDPSAPRARRIRPRIAAAAISTALLAAGIFGLWPKNEAKVPEAFALADSRELPVPEEPSIVVLPFSNMSGDIEQEHFADGLTDTLITDLSRLHKILVIARNSAFAYKGRPVDVRQVGKELGVRHVLEGSVQSARERLRVNVQLTEASTGTHVWAERYDRSIEDMFSVQDEIADRIVEELDVNLVTGEQARRWRRMTRNPEAYSEVLAGRAIQRSDHSVDGIMRSRAHFRRAIELDPSFALPYAYMVSCYIHLTDAGYSDEPDVSYQTALKYAERSVELSPDLPIGRAYLGAVYQQLERYEEAERACKLAVQSGPNEAESLMLAAWCIAAVGDPNEALPIALRALRLDPVPPGWYWGGLGDTYLRLQDWETAIPVFERCLVESVDLIWCRAGLTAAYVRAGRIEEARLSALDWRRINPKVQAKDNFYLLAWGDPEFRRLLADAFTEAGL